ncbi:uncharacterized protein HaLaN_26893 [Haematococcus lacustris]|uniref:Uncharacterized protein n=1 Tax=Haematococcus lacustris TaxID=44745 RepID=A0A6A0A742_HAELA|nr:uncharacterized protein HaLaN_26893 [Haematococcus lacustris]
MPARGPPDWLQGVKTVAQYEPANTIERQRLINAGGLQKEFFLDTKLNLLLFALPVAIISKNVGWGDGPTFVLSMLALCPLAEGRKAACKDDISNNDGVSRENERCIEAVQFQPHGTE